MQQSAVATNSSCECLRALDQHDFFPILGDLVLDSSPEELVLSLSLCNLQAYNMQMCGWTCLCSFHLLVVGGLGHCTDHKALPSQISKVPSSRLQELPQLHKYRKCMGREKEQGV